MSVFAKICYLCAMKQSKLVNMKVGDKVLISPDLTLQREDHNIFFGQEDLFKPAKEEVCLP